jgi:hypothetical protein
MPAVPAAETDEQGPDGLGLLPELREAPIDQGALGDQLGDFSLEVEGWLGGSGGLLRIRLRLAHDFLGPLMIVPSLLIAL